MLDNLPATSAPARTLGEFACGLTFEHIQRDIARITAALDPSHIELRIELCEKSFSKKKVASKCPSVFDQRGET